MLFNSATFLVFFALVLLVDRLLPWWRARKFMLLLASYLFYAAWNPPFVILIWVSTAADWVLARKIHQASGVRRRRLFLVASLVVNLGLLGFFKYGGFLLENFQVLVRSLGLAWSPAAASIVLPVGISFYTFQTLSYTLDVYAGRARPWRSLLDFSLFVTFFPQLVAGPIVRASEFLPQCRQARRASPRQLSWGGTLLLLGLFQKMVVADGLLGPLADRIFQGQGPFTFLDAWAGTLAFSGQIFSDFAGYSSCAIGVALCLGFSIPINFRMPYAAIGFSDFWRRWHITLSAWLRDYLYIPLGGNKKGRIRTYVNLMVTMLLGGLWHGASWTFVAWGGLHGLFLALERAVRPRRPLRGGLSWPLALLLGLSTYGLVNLAWVFFRSRTFSGAFVVLAGMFGLSDADTPSQLTGTELWTVFVVTAFLLATHWILKDKPLGVLAARCPWWARGIALGLLFVAIACMSGYDRAFIYFQF